MIFEWKDHFIHQLFHFFVIAFFIVSISNGIAVDASKARMIYNISIATFC